MAPLQVQDTNRRSSRYETFVLRIFVGLSSCVFFSGLFFVLAQWPHPQITVSRSFWRLRRLERGCGTPGMQYAPDLDLNSTSEYHLQYDSVEEARVVPCLLDFDCYTGCGCTGSHKLQQLAVGGNTSITEKEKRGFPRIYEAIVPTLSSLEVPRPSMASKLAATSPKRSTTPLGPPQQSIETCCRVFHLHMRLWRSVRVC